MFVTEEIDCCLAKRRSGVKTDALFSHIFIHGKEYVNWTIEVANAA